jgi:hypothetical protein
MFEKLGHPIVMSICAALFFGMRLQSANAALFLSASAPTVLPGPDSLVQYTIRMHSSGAEIVDGFSYASVSTVAGLGVHQVWIPTIDTPTPTRQSHLDVSTLWNDAWLPYDTYYFPTNANSLKTPGEIVETNLGSGAVLPQFGFGAPRTGFGEITSPLVPGPPNGLDLPVAYAYTLASGLQGKNVPLMQIVLRAQDQVQVSARVLTTTGNNATVNLIVGVPEPAPLTLIAVSLSATLGFRARRTRRTS